MGGVTLDMSTATPLDQPVKMDMSTAQPLDVASHKVQVSNPAGVPLWVDSSDIQPDRDSDGNVTGSIRVKGVPGYTIGQGGENNLSPWQRTKKIMGGLFGQDVAVTPEEQEQQKSGIKSLQTVKDSQVVTQNPGEDIKYYTPQGAPITDNNQQQVQQNSNLHNFSASKASLNKAKANLQDAANATHKPGATIGQDIQDTVAQQAAVAGIVGNLANAGIGLIPGIGNGINQQIDASGTALGQGKPISAGVEAAPVIGPAVMGMTAEALAPTKLGQAVMRPFRGAAQGATTPYKGASNPQSTAAMRVVAGADLNPETIEHIHGTANQMGFQPEDFAKANLDSQKNANAVYKASSQGAAQEYGSLLKPISNNEMELPAAPQGIRNLIANQYESTNPDFAQKIRTGSNVTYGEGEQIRQQVINKKFSGDQVYTGPEQAGIDSFGSRLRDNIYDGIADTGVDPDQLSKLKMIQGDLIQNEGSFQSGTKTAGTTNAKLNAGNAAQNWMARNTGITAFKGGVGPGISNLLTASTDKAAMLENAFKYAGGAEPFRIQANASIPIGNIAQSMQPSTIPQLTRGPLQTPIVEGEYVPSNPQPVDATTRAQRLGLLLPAETGGIRLGPGDIDQPGQLLNANKEIQRNPSSGQMQRMYVTSGEQGEPQTFYQKNAGDGADTPTPDRRIDGATRTKMSQMSPDELHDAIFKDELTGLPNRRAFEVAQSTNPANALAVTDAAGLKAFNDNLGHAAGDQLLKVKADVLRQLGLDVSRAGKGADEFFVRGDSMDELDQKLKQANEIMRNREIEVEDQNGNMRGFKGADFSYGLGQDSNPEAALKKADSAMNANKAQRRTAGDIGERGEFGKIKEIDKGANQ